jgi:hypothetical protein
MRLPRALPCALRRALALRLSCVCHAFVCHALCRACVRVRVCAHGPASRHGPPQGCVMHLSCVLPSAFCHAFVVNDMYLSCTCRHAFVMRFAVRSPRICHAFVSMYLSCMRHAFALRAAVNKTANCTNSGIWGSPTKNGGGGRRSTTGS